MRFSALTRQSLATNNPLQVTQPKKPVSWSAVSRSPQDNIDVRIQATKQFKNGQDENATYVTFDQRDNILKSKTTF